MLDFPLPECYTVRVIPHEGGQTCEKSGTLYRRRLFGQSRTGRYGEHEKELSGGAHDTTNNRMELTAVIEGLKALKEPCMVTVYSDSKYFCDGVQKGWVYGWKRRGWKKSDGKPALNPDLWEELLTQLGRHQVEIVWVKGHAGHPENERCDRLAVAQSEKHR